jgi:excisionase family DNA binding protein
MGLSSRREHCEYRSRDLRGTRLGGRAPEPRANQRQNEHDGPEPPCVPLHERAAAVQPSANPVGEASITTRSQTPDLNKERDEWLTVEEVCTELKISRRTFDRWRALGKGPRSKRIGGDGPVRVKRSWLDEWAEGSDRDIA